jgi:hypothetical protein
MLVFINDSKKITVSVVSEELLRGSSVLKAPFLVRHVVSFSTAFVPKQHLWQLPYVVSVNCAGRPAFGTERSREDNSDRTTARAAVPSCQFDCYRHRGLQKISTFVPCAFHNISTTTQTNSALRLFAVPDNGHSHCDK